MFPESAPDVLPSSCIIQLHARTLNQLQALSLAFASYKVTHALLLVLTSIGASQKISHDVCIQVAPALPKEVSLAKQWCFFHVRPVCSLEAKEGGAVNNQSTRLPLCIVM